MAYLPADNRYDNMIYRHCGKSGLKLPVLSLGLWQNFGGLDVFETGREMVLKSFDAGITHFDLANNYGPPAGSAEENFGKMLEQDLGAYRDELVISTKAGYWMWNGPYGEWGSKKYLTASLDQSLDRMGLDYVDIFYSHRFDPDTPLEETMEALAQAVHSGKALYVGISSYGPKETEAAVDILADMGVRCLIHQPRYNMFDRWIEDGLTDVLAEKGIGGIAFSPLDQGFLTPRYFDGIPTDSRAGKAHGTVSEQEVTEQKVNKARKLNEVAKARGQSLPQLALTWNLRLPEMTSVIIGASRWSQIEDNLGILDKLELSDEEVDQIEAILKG